MKIKQINKEAIITCILYLIYFGWWYYFAYEYPKGKEIIFGLPAWFFYSCVMGLIVINFLVFLSVKLFFKDVKLEDEKEVNK